MATAAAETSAPNLPDIRVKVRQTFGIDSDLEVPAFSKATDHVPAVDEAYRFDRETTLAILAGFAHNRRVLIQGYHGTGKSTHIEQVAARLNWPCVRVNLDSHISRIDLIGKDAIVLKDGKQITEFREGMLPWAIQRPIALVFDEYDAGRPDVMFVIQRVLEAQGRLTLLDQNRVIRPNRWFRLFSTTNTIGLGDTSGLYHGTRNNVSFLFSATSAQFCWPLIVCPLAFIAGRRSRELRRVGLTGTRHLVGPRLSWIEGSHLYPFERPDDTAALALQMLDELRAARATSL